MAKNSQYRRYTRSTAGNIGYFTILILMSIIMVFPLVYCLVTSFKPLDELLIFPPKFIVERPTLTNYRVLPALLSNLQIPISRYLFNTLLITVVTTTCSIIIGSMAAFTFSKSKLKGARICFVIIQTMMLYNGATLGVPQYLIFSKLGLIDTYWVYILPSLASTVHCFLMKQFMDASVNQSLLEAARIDGAGVVSIYWKIVMPIMKPALMTVLLFSFQAMWSVVPGGTIFSEQLKTLPYVMSSVAAGGIARQGSSMAISVILMIPPITVFLVTQSNVLETMSSSGIKE